MRRRLVALTAAAPRVRDAAVAARERRLRRHSGHDRRQKNPRSREGPRGPSRAPRRSVSRHARTAAIHGLSMAEAPVPAHRCQTPSSGRVSTDPVPASNTEAREVERSRHAPRGGPERGRRRALGPTSGDARVGMTCRHRADPSRRRERFSSGAVKGRKKRVSLRPGPPCSRNNGALATLSLRIITH